MELTNYKNKIKDVFIKLFQPGFEINSSYAENLLRHLEEYPDKGK